MFALNNYGMLFNFFDAIILITKKIVYHIIIYAANVNMHFSAVGLVTFFCGIVPMVIVVVIVAICKRRQLKNVVEKFSNR